LAAASATFANQARRGEIGARARGRETYATRWRARRNAGPDGDRGSCERARDRSDGGVLHQVRGGVEKRPGGQKAHTLDLRTIGQRTYWQDGQIVGLREGTLPAELVLPHRVRRLAIGDAGPAAGNLPLRGVEPGAFEPAPRIDGSAGRPRPGHGRTRSRDADGVRCWGRSRPKPRYTPASPVARGLSPVISCAWPTFRNIDGAILRLLRRRRRTAAQ